MRSRSVRFWPLVFVIGVILNLVWIGSALLPRSQSQEALKYFDQAFLNQSQRHARLSYINSGIESLAFLSVAFLFGRYVSSAYSSGRSSLIKGGASSLAFFDALGKGAMIGFIAATVLFMVGLPFRLYGGFYLERSFGLSKETLSSFLLDSLKGYLLNAIVFLVSGAFIAAIIRASRGLWVLWATLGFLVLSIFGAFIYPRYVAPLFDTFHPLEEGPVAQEIRDLSQKAGMEVGQVLVLEASKKTTRVNAYFAGIGSTKEVVLYDTLLQGHSLEEIRLVLAHELGHWKFGHIWKGILASALGTFILLSLFSSLAGSFLGISLPSTTSLSARELSKYLVAFFAFIILFSYITTPFSNLLSRRFEVQSDAFSLELTQDPTTFIKTQINLAKKNLSDVDPPLFIKWFSWTHPSTLDRIRMAEK